MTVSSQTVNGAPAPIPAPPDFPVVWENPEDERLFWTRDRVHYPDQLAPLTAYTLGEGVLPGWYAAAAAYELPVVGPRGQLINGYIYTTMVPVKASAEELAARGKRSEQKLTAAIARLGTLWDEEWLPEIKRHLGFWDDFDASRATLPELSAHLEETIKRFQRLYEIHFLCFFPASLALSLFDDLYHDLFGSDSAFAPYRLLQGFDNKSLETDRALWQLSRKAKAEPEVLAVLETCDAGSVSVALEASDAGRAFLADLRAFLAEYGTRSDKFGFDWPSWIEDPTPVIINLKQYVAQAGRDKADHPQALASERDQLLAEARGRLKGYPRPVVDRFEMLLAAAQTATVLIEDHAFWIDYGSTFHVRRLFLEFGRRFTGAGVVETSGDILYLSLDELRATAGALAGVGSAVDRAGLVAARRAEYARFRNAMPPPALGTPPQGSPPDTPFGRVIGRFFGTPPVPPTGGVLRGSPASPGRARGKARIIASLQEAGRLTPGDVLVAETTLPPWTPLFATASAVVTDSGGILSHCAIVAREYRIPAVVGVGAATRVIKDGQLVEVDGDAGEVRILSSS